MAACKGIAAYGKCALVLLTLFVVLLNVELSQADCDQKAIENGMRPCFGVTGVPASNGACCVAMRGVKTSLNPSDKCICDLAGAAGFTPEAIALVIKNCIDESAVPSCSG